MRTILIILLSVLFFLSMILGVDVARTLTTSTPQQKNTSLSKQAFQTKREMIRL